MLSELNQKYYQLFSELYDAKSSLPAKAHDLIADHLMKEYKRELDAELGNVLLATAREVFEQRVKLSLYIPRRRLGLFRNKIAKAFERRIVAEFHAYLASLHDETDAFSHSFVDDDIDDISDETEEQQVTVDVVPVVSSPPDVVADEEGGEAVSD